MLTADGMRARESVCVTLSVLGANSSRRRGSDDNMTQQQQVVSSQIL